MNTQIYQLTSNKTIKKLLKRWKLGIIFLFSLIVVLCFFGPFKIIFDHQFWVNFLQTYRCCTIPIFIIAYILLTVMGIPGTILTVVGGILFGIVWGTFLSLIGATLGALGAFLVARYLGQDYVKTKFNQNGMLSKFHDAVLKHPMKFVLMVRFAPISPFNVVNFLFGLTPIHWLSYTWATFIGIIPGTLIYTWLGVSGVHALQGSDRLSFFLALGFLCLLSLIPILMRSQMPVKSR